MFKISQASDVGFDPHRPYQIFIMFQRVAENLAPSISSTSTTNRFCEVLPQCRNAGLGSKLEVCIGGRAQRPRHRWQESDPKAVKVATQDTAGAFFLTEQPISRKWAGPPKHFHYEQDEWFYCLAGEYVVEVGSNSNTTKHW